MPYDDLDIPASPRLEPSAAVELSWLLYPCVKPELVSSPLKERATHFWEDGLGIQPEVLVLAQQLDCLTGWDIDPLFSLDSRRLSPLPTVDLRTETPEVRRAIGARLARLRASKRLRSRYSALLSDTWSHCLDEWNAVGRPAVERALVRMRSSLEHGLAPIDLIPGNHVARRETLVGFTRDALGTGTALVSPCYFAGERGHTVALPGVLSLAIGIGVSQDIARRRTAVEHVARGLKLLADPTRLLILTELEREPAGVGDIGRRVGAAQATTSVHVKQLREAGFIVASKEAGGVVYRVRPEQLRRVLDSARDVTGAGID